MSSLGQSSVYTAIKHGVRGLSDAMRRDFVELGVGVSVLCPGLVQSRLWDSRRNRPGRFGGAAPAPADYEARVTALLTAQAQDPRLTAGLMLDDVARGEFPVLTHPETASFAKARIAEIEAALARLPTG